MGILQFDTARLNTMNSTISSTISDLEYIKGSMKTQMDALKEKWNTPAGKKFFEEQDLDWEKAVNDYIKVLKTMNEMITYAIQKYEPVQKEAEKLSIPTAQL